MYCNPQLIAICKQLKEKAHDRKGYRVYEGYRLFLLLRDRRLNGNLEGIEIIINGRRKEEKEAIVQKYL